VLKVVLDTNQFISGTISKHGPSASILNAWREHAYMLIICKAILDELERTLRYPRIIEEYGLGLGEVKKIVSFLEREALVIQKIPEVNIVKDDPDDNKIIACALAAEADYIISGDKHLLKIKQHERIPIIGAKEFLSIIQT
jgi:uncharacterized protein